MKQDTIPANSTKKESEEGERNVMLNASDANKPPRNSNRPSQRGR